MQENGAVAGYKSATITSADPVTITTMLMEGAIKALKKSQLHEQAGNREAFLKEAERAQLIIGELLTALDHDAGGDVAQNLEAIYVYCMRTIVEATVDGPKKIGEVIGHLERIVSAWKTATDGLIREEASLPSDTDSSRSVA